MNKVNYYVIPGLPKADKSGMDIDLMLLKTAIFFDISVEELVSSCRKREYVDARKFFYYYGKKVECKTLLTLSTATGGRDHTTVIHAIRRLQDIFDTEPAYRRKWAKFIDYMGEKLAA